ncbi:hypothetical protein L7F22_023434 [Adiantum nelumboides]|nr:hypothetical protein [Adiantum nelumboides]
MTAVLGCAVLVLHAPSSADSCALPFTLNVALPSRLSALKRRSRRRVVEAGEGRSFVYLLSNELAHGHVEFGARHSFSERNERVTRASVQEECVSRWRILPAYEGKRLWARWKQQPRNVKASAMHQSAGFKFHEFAHTSDDFTAENQNEASYKKSRSSPSVQNYYGSLRAMKHPKAPLPTENQQSRLHNEVTIFEGVIEPRNSCLPHYNDAYQWSLPEDANDAFSKARVQPKSNTERLEHNHNYQKGKLFMSTLEEELSSLRKEVDVPKQIFPLFEKDQRSHNALWKHAGQDSQDWTSGGQRTQVIGVKVDLKGKDTQMTRPFDHDYSVEDATTAKPKDSNQGEHGKGYNISGHAREGLQSDLGQVKLVLNKTGGGDEARFTSFNLFSSPPSVPWEADKSHLSTAIPVCRKRRPFSRQLPTSVGSRSSPSRRSVTSRNNGCSKFGSHGIRGDGVLNVNRGETQTSLRFDNSYSMEMQDKEEEILIDCSKRALKFTKQEGNFGSLESQVTNGVILAIESGTTEELTEPQSGGKEDFFTQGAPEVEDSVNRARLNAKRGMPLKSSLLAIHNHDDSDSEGSLTDVLDLSSNSNVSALAKTVTVLQDCEDLTCDHSDFLELDDKKVSPFVSDEAPTYLSSGEVEERNTFETSQGNANEIYSGDKEENTPASAYWHKHNLPDLPFEFQFSYSETPQRPILRYREPSFSPFGPPNVKRPWIGGRPTPPSKKKTPVFDSFKPPPQDLKGVKHVQAPGPYPPGQGPKTAKSREEILGEPLTKEEIVYLVEKCRREPRQLNLGRDGLTHNMLDLIHLHWKRRRVCRIKCKGVPTVDMDNLMFHIEDKTGGKIIFHTGGVVYLFRGRNYNYKDRPYIPLMLWKPTTPVYPKLIQPAPEGLIEEEAQRLRQMGRKVEPICKLGKNGVYLTLVDEVRAAFKVDELVRVDCQGLNPSDYKKIGAKLRDLVPCVLLSFDKEHILMWKGKQETAHEGTNMSQATESQAAADDTCNGEEHSHTSFIEVEEAFKSPMAPDRCAVGEGSGSLARANMLSVRRDDNPREEADLQLLSLETVPSSFLVRQAGDHKGTSVRLGTSEGQADEDILMWTGKRETTAKGTCMSEAFELDATADNTCNALEHSNPSIDEVDKKAFNLPTVEDPCEAGEGSRLLDRSNTHFLQQNDNSRKEVDLQLISSETLSSSFSMHRVGNHEDTSVGLAQVNEDNTIPSHCEVDVDALWEHASQSGMAIELLEEDIDSDMIIRKADELAKSAPLAPEYTTKLIHKLRVHREPNNKRKDELQINFGRVLTQRPKKEVKRNLQLPTVGVPGMGGLPVDELAKLLVKN